MIKKFKNGRIKATGDDANEILKMLKQSSPNIGFDIWYTHFFQKCRSLGYNGPIDADSATNDYNEWLTADEAAESFVKEMMS
jgi:hypothetical protein